MNIQGVEDPVILRVGTTDMRTFRQVFIKNDYSWDLDAEPKCIIDAGANIGLTSVFFANRYPAAKIFSIEPELANFELLCRNVAPYPNVTPLQAALWNKDTEIALVDPGFGEWGFRTQDSNGNDESRPLSHRVAAVTIEQLMKTYDLESIDLLKVDIEGAEVEVFGTSQRWIAAVRSVIVELHERFRPGCDAVFDKVAADFEIRQTRGDMAYVARKGAVAKCAHSPSRTVKDEDCQRDLVRVRPRECANTTRGQRAIA